MDDDKYDTYELGCTECGTIFNVEDLYGGGCPVCESSNIVNFNEALEIVMAHRQFMEGMGLEVVE